MIKAQKCFFFEFYGAVLSLCQYSEWAIGTRILAKLAHGVIFLLDHKSWLPVVQGLKFMI